MDEFDLEICERIKFLINDIYKTTSYAFAIKCKLSEHIVNGMMNRTVKPRPEYIDNILNALPEVHKTWLCMGDKPIIIKGKTTQYIPVLEHVDKGKIAHRR